MVVRIEPEALAILAKHTDGKGTISEQVRAMDKKIEYEMSSKMSSSSTAWIPGDNLVDGMPREYWKRLKFELEAVKGR